MNKKKILFAAFAAIALQAGFVSCSSDDDEKSDNSGQIDDTSVVNDDASALALVNGLYSNLQRLSSSYTFIVESAGNKLISFEGEESEPGPVVSRFEQQADTWYQVKIFNYLFLTVTQANEAIAKLDNSLAKEAITKNGYAAAVGKAKLLRALSNLKLVQLWGEIPLVTEKGGSATERKSIDEVYAQIISDLEDAESKLLDYNGDPRVPSKQAAQALLARAYLTWGENPLTQDQVSAIANEQRDPEFSKTDSRLQKAVEYADKVISSGKLALNPDYSKLFGRDYESNKLGDNEQLLTIAHDGDATDAQGNHQTHCSWTFPFQNGEFGSGFQDNHTEVADDDLYDNWKAEQPNDKRLAVTYLTEITNPDDGKVYTYYSPVYTPINGKGVDQSYPHAIIDEIKANSIDRIEIRYAEVLLTKAEALVLLNKSSEAAAPFNELRERAGIEKVEAPTFDQIKREWDYEFTYEQFDLYNHLRWKDLVSATKQVSTYKHFADDWRTKANYTERQAAFFEKVYKHLHAKYDNVRGKHYRQPIPTGLSGEDLGIQQNPGY